MRLVALGPGQEQGEKAIPILGLDAIWIDFDRQRQRAVEFAGDTFPSMHAGFVGVANVLLAGNADGICLGLDLQIVLVDAGNSMIARMSSPC
jgi:hypothetical protein